MLLIVLHILQVGEHEVECDPRFRLYLHTTSESHEIPAEIGTYVLMIYFHMTRSDIEEELLDRFMAKEKSRVDEEKMTLLQVWEITLRNSINVIMQLIRVNSIDHNNHD